MADSNPNFSQFARMLRDMAQGISSLTKRVRVLETRRGVYVAGGGGSAHIIQDEGADMPPQDRLNFIGSAVTVTNNAGISTDVTIAGGGDCDAILTDGNDVLIDANGNVLCT